METSVQNGFTSWFDTPYYHILYKDRGYDEAQEFMQNLVSFLKLKKGASILDLACGRGRHSISLNELGFEVTGVDLSKNSIAYAEQFENENLHFGVQCMFKPMNKKFDAVFNLFTSFGYFEREIDNLRTIKAIKHELKESGHGVIDFMNAKKVIKNLVPFNTKPIQDIIFRLRRSYQNAYILKNIEFEDNGTLHIFHEKVKALTLEDFLSYFREAGIELKHTFGSYQLDDFNEEESDRLILVFK